MSLKAELQTLNNKKDKIQRKLDKARARADIEMLALAERELAAVTKQLEALKGQQGRQNSDKATTIKEMAFNRALTKAEQADLGKLKKSVKGLITVHPLTALGRELGVTVMTGYAPKSF